MNGFNIYMVLPTPPVLRCLLMLMKWTGTLGMTVAGINMHKRNILLKKGRKTSRKTLSGRLLFPYDANIG